MSVSDHWYALLRIDGDDFVALDKRQGPAAAQPKLGYIIDYISGGSKVGTLVLWLTAAERDDALTKAAETYVSLRASAGLCWRDPRILGVRGSGEVLSLHDEIVLEAAHLTAEGRYELAVLRVQTVAELAAEQAYQALFGPKLSPEHQPEAGRLISRTLSDERSRNILQAITGLRPDHEEWWPEYREHIRRRNEVTHAGRAVDRSEAEASVRAALRFVDYLAFHAME
jgi:hypothetical protein